ncbi:uncharacterized protein [Cherax quadricarinatus]|uniref:uncharacterized protein isoform X1 n=1 Tax=Cherax quadricarinatus TaxID=27406 RepID=UPI00387E7B98
MLFSGTALNIYATLLQDICNYNLLKKAILKAYQKTTNSYRKDFRYATLQPGQNFQQLQVTHFRLLDFWIESSGIDHSYESLRDFMVADQFLTALPHQIRTFIRERNLIKAEEVAEVADLYAEAHNSYKDLKGSNLKGNGSPEPKIKKPTVEAKSPAIIPTCHQYGGIEHKRPDCPSKKIEKVGRCFVDGNDQAPFCSGAVNGIKVSDILRDTGCTCIVISDKLFPYFKTSRVSSILSDYLGRENTFPTIRCYLKTKCFTRWTNAVLAPITCSIIVGNIKGAVLPSEADLLSPPVDLSFPAPLPCKLNNPLNNSAPEAALSRTVHLGVETDDTALDSEVAGSPVHSSGESKGIASGTLNVLTRAQTITPVSPTSSSPTVSPFIFPDFMSKDDFVSIQHNCPSLRDCHNQAFNNKVIHGRYVSHKFEYINGILYKSVFKSHSSVIDYSLLVVPKPCQETVLQMAHDLPMTEHLAHRKTWHKLKHTYFWPSMYSQVTKKYSSCNRCQVLTAQNTHTLKSCIFIKSKTSLLQKRDTPP